MFIKFVIKDFILSFLLTVVLFFALEYWLHIDENILPYILGIVFIMIFVFSASMSFYLFKMKNKLEILNDQLDKLKRYDEISSVFKRNYIMDLFEKYVSISKRQNLPLSVMIIDIDSFKEINKYYGHETGDKILKEIGNILKKEIRGMDLVGRFGGDEFIIVGLVSNKEFNNLAKRIHSKIQNHVFEHGINLSVSIGLSELKKEEDQSKLLKRAEEALFLAKQKGGNRVDYLEHFLLFE